MSVNWANAKDFLAWFALIAGAYKAVEYLLAKTPTARLFAEMEEMKKHLDSDNKQLKKHDNELCELKTAMKEMSKTVESQNKYLNEAINMLGTSQISMINHMITGNGQEELKKERDEMTDFFINRQ